MKSRRLRSSAAEPPSIALENEKAARRRPSVCRNWGCQRISDVPELVTATGLPALMTWLVWAVWL